ncbi:hypothetical protein Drorol1_Dr00001487 [Drosera rotundifolia]
MKLRDCSPGFYSRLPVLLDASWICRPSQELLQLIPMAQGVWAAHGIKLWASRFDEPAEFISWALRIWAISFVGFLLRPWCEIVLHVVGISQDISSEIDAKLKLSSSLVVCFGEILVDFVPSVSGVSLAEAPAFKKAPGGAPANVAVGIAEVCL